MRIKRMLFPLALVLFLLSAASAETFGIACPAALRPYEEAQIAVTVTEAGTLTISVADATLQEKDIVTDAPVQAGQNLFSYNALSYNGQPLKTGNYVLTAELKTQAGETRTATCTAKILAPKAALEYALPSADQLYLSQTDPWYLDVKLSAKGTIVCDYASADAPQTVLYSTSTSALDPLKSYRAYWKGQDKKKNPLPAGEYVVTAYCAENPMYQIKNTVTLREGAGESLPVETSVGDWFPAQDATEAEIWEKLMEPVVIIDAAQMSRGKFYEKPDEKSKLLGSVYGTTVAVRVLELGVGKFAKIGAYCSFDGEYREGYILQKYLKTVRPNAHYAAVLDKKKQTMDVYADGKKLGTMRVSTGLMTGHNYAAETRGGVYLTYDRLTDFHDNGYRYDYAIRIDGPNLIHQIGYTYASAVKADFSKQQAMLGTKASHGCVRMDNLITENSGGVNAYWCWTHFSVRTKIIMIDDTQERQALLAELKKKK